MIRIGIGLGITRLQGRTFSPASIPGLVAWYDPSDLDTLYQDRNAVDPVTTAGDPVGLVFDESAGLIRGDEIHPDPTFQDVGQWATGPGWSVSGGTGRLTSPTTPGPLIRGGGTCVAGKVYEITVTVISNTSPGFSFAPYFSGEVVLPDMFAPGETGTKKVMISPLTTAIFALRCAGSGTGEIVLSEFSVKEVTGNHLTQPTAAARPTYQSGGTLADDGVDDALILRLTGTYSVYMAHGSTLESVEDVTMAEDYDVLRDGLIGAVVTDDPLDAATRARLATFWGVA